MQNLDMFTIIASIAERIAQQDFRVTISRYMTSGNSPWIITVGEGDWSRHLVVESVMTDGSDAFLTVLSLRQSGKFGPDIDVNDLQYRYRLGAILGKGYPWMKAVLSQENPRVAVTN